MWRQPWNLIALLRQDETILSDYVIDQRLDRELLNTNIVVNLGNRRPIYTDTRDFKTMLDTWFLTNQRTITELLDTLEYDYNPIENYNRIDDKEVTSSGSGTRTREDAADRTLHSVDSRAGHEGIVDSTTDNLKEKTSLEKNSTTDITGGDTTTGSDSKKVTSTSSGNDTITTHEVGKETTDGTITTDASASTSDVTDGKVVFDGETSTTESGESETNTSGSNNRTYSSTSSNNASVTESVSAFNSTGYHPDKQTVSTSTQTSSGTDEGSDSSNSKTTSSGTSKTTQDNTTTDKTTVTGSSSSHSGTDEDTVVDSVKDLTTTNTSSGDSTEEITGSTSGTSTHTGKEVTSGSDSGESTSDRSIDRTGTHDTTSQGDSTTTDITSGRITENIGNSGTSKETYLSHGNIGVTTTQRMIELQRQTVQFNVYDWIVDKLDSYLFLQIFW